MANWVQKGVTYAGIITTLAFAGCSKGGGSEVQPTPPPVTPPPTQTGPTGGSGGATVYAAKVMGISTSSLVLAKNTTDGSYSISNFDGFNIFGGGFSTADGANATIKMKLRNPGTITTAMVGKTPFISFSNIQTQDPSNLSKIDTTKSTGIELDGNDLIAQYGTNRVLIMLCKTGQDNSAQIGVSSQQDLSIFTPELVQKILGTDAAPRSVVKTNLAILPTN
jgi:hypothetical protein